MLEGGFETFNLQREKPRSACFFLTWNLGSRGHWSKSSFCSPLSQCPVDLLKPSFPLTTTDKVLVEFTDPNFTIVCWQQTGHIALWIFRTTSPCLPTSPHLAFLFHVPLLLCFLSLTCPLTCYSWLTSLSIHPQFKIAGLCLSPGIIHSLIRSFIHLFLNLIAAWVLIWLLVSHPLSKS